MAAELSGIEAHAFRSLLNDQGDHLGRDPTVAHLLVMEVAEDRPFGDRGRRDPLAVSAHRASPRVRAAQLAAFAFLVGFRTANQDLFHRAIRAYGFDSERVAVLYP
jgi:hypothetical protein